MASEDLLAAVSSDPNGYVEVLQEMLAERGYYRGPVDAQLTAATIAAINDFCRDEGLQDFCKHGPLSSAGSRAIVLALGGEPQAAAEEVTETPAGEPAQISTTVAEPAQLDWVGIDRNGLSFTITPRDDGAVEIHLEGVTTAADWVNAQSAMPVPAAGGEAWTFTVRAAIPGGAPTDGVTARIASFGPNGKYLRELVPAGVPISGAASTAYTVSGTTGEGTVAVHPYLQFRYEAGVEVDVTVLVEAARIEPAT